MPRFAVKPVAKVAQRFARPCVRPRRSAAAKTLRAFAIASVALSGGGGGVAWGQPVLNQTPATIATPMQTSATFSLHAPNAESVELVGGDIQGLSAEARRFAKDGDGNWTLTVDGLKPGAYRYRFAIDGVHINDPKNTAISESNTHNWSLLTVPGSPWFDVKNVPHGSLSQVTYHSKALGKQRRMHVYTPPGYETSDQSYPVLYLMHGAYDSDGAWPTVGRACQILDNLIAAGQAVPMVVVMPNAHTKVFDPQAEHAFHVEINAFVDDLEQDIRPLVESRYRLVNDRAHRAVAGLSMGGAETLEAMGRNLGDYAYFGVFSSGVFNLRGDPATQPGARFPEIHADVLDDASLKDGTELVWFAIGKDDFLFDACQATIKMLDEHGFDVTYQETAGGHVWWNWRDYLVDFVPMLFQED